MRGKKKDSHLYSAENVLHSLLGKSRSPLGEQFLRWRLWSRWQEVVGPTLAQDSEPVGFRHGQLYVWVKSSARMQDFHYVVGDLKDNINRWAGRDWVKFIKLTTNRNEVPKELNEKSGQFIKKGF